MIGNHNDICRFTAQQLASTLMRLYCSARGIDHNRQQELRMPVAHLHMHDSSQVEIVWNDVQAVQKYNAFSGHQLDVPMTASEGYNRHGHTSDFDGGWVPGLGIHDHRDASRGGFAFACYHPGTSLPQQPWGI